MTEFSNTKTEKRLPEKVLQFGTGILLRGLPDYFIDKANKQNIFNGSVLVVKSTAGNTNDFTDHGAEFTTFVRGVENGKPVKEDFRNNAISRVLSAADHWPEILSAAAQKDIQIIISNTTEVGLQYTAEAIFQSPPVSFPGKLTAFLHQRYITLGDDSPMTVVIPTELIPGNGERLAKIVEQLVAHNDLGESFSNWIQSKIIFCNSLVDRIVTRVSGEILKTLPSPDPLAIQTEPYRLWAIEGGEAVKNILSFAKADEGVVVATDIESYRERKLRLLNGTHTISVCLGYLNGLNTVYECMENPAMRTFINGVLLQEIMPTISVGLPSETLKFGGEVLDRFHNPFTEHKLLSITFQSTMKMKMRNIPTLLKYVKKSDSIPKLFTKGFAAYLLFMKIVKKEGNQYFGQRGGEFYPVVDDAAEYFCEKWQSLPVPELVREVCGNQKLWDHDLNELPGFTTRVIENIISLQQKN